MKRALVFSLLVGAVVVACGSQSRVNPLAQGAPDAGSHTGVSGPLDKPGTPPTPPTPKRTVIQRNPYGDIAATDNMLWDGDFEWQTAFGDEYGWVDAAFFSAVGTYPEIRIGADCHSGMKCGYLKAENKATAIGVAPSGAEISASAWTKPPSGKCSEVQVQLFSCAASGEPVVPLVDADDKPDADGWCHVEAIAAARTTATCMLFQAKFKGSIPALIDDAVVQPAPVGAHAYIAYGPPSPLDLAAVKQMQKILRTYLKPTTRPPNAALRAYRAWRAAR